MLSRIRRRFTYANVLMTLALVFAMSGGAYAAKRYLVTSTKQISPKVLKALTGKKGANGANGAQGSPGPAGAPGAVGPAGPSRTQGRSRRSRPGPAGANGESVINTELKKGNAICKEGGAEFKAGAGTATHACNGKEGSPWTAGGTLPKGSSERGQWVLAGKASGPRFTSLSFPIPSAAPLPEAKSTSSDPKKAPAKPNPPQPSPTVNARATSKAPAPRAKTCASSFLRPFSAHQTCT